MNFSKFIFILFQTLKAASMFLVLKCVWFIVCVKYFCGRRSSVLEEVEGLGGLRSVCYGYDILCRFVGVGELWSDVLLVLRWSNSHAIIFSCSNAHWETSESASPLLYICECVSNPYLHTPSLLSATLIQKDIANITPLQSRTELNQVCQLCILISHER